MVPVCSRH